MYFCLSGTMRLGLPRLIAQGSPTESRAINLDEIRPRG